MKQTVEVSRRFQRTLGWTALWCIIWATVPAQAFSQEMISTLSSFSSADVMLIADPKGTILHQYNGNKKYTPASTLKILTGLAVLHHLSPQYRFKTEFFINTDQDLAVKGYGDPLLISEIWREIALDLASRLESFRNLLVDNTYFCSSIRIPGRGRSTNPYDAPVGALSANFNTVFYHRDEKGKIVSAEPQTPITPLARRRIPDLGPETGRYTFLQEEDEIARYAGELLAHFLKKLGVVQSGGVYARPVGDTDRLIHTYRSRFPLETAVEKMLEYSNNFMANQLLVALGAHVHGAPGTLQKGISSLETFCEERLGIKAIQLVEGSGISRENQVTAMDMLRILKAFTGYRHLLTRQGNIRYKSGTLRGIRTRAGYIEPPGKGPHPFVLFLKDSEMDIERVMDAIAKTVR